MRRSLVRAEVGEPVIAATTLWGGPLRFGRETSLLHQFDPPALRPTFLAVAAAIGAKPPFRKVAHPRPERAWM